MTGALTNITLFLHAELFFTELVSEIHVIVLIMFFEFVFFLSYVAYEVLFFSLEAFSMV